MTTEPQCSRLMATAWGRHSGQTWTIEDRLLRPPCDSLFDATLPVQTPAPVLLDDDLATTDLFVRLNDFMCRQPADHALVKVDTLTGGNCWERSRFGEFVFRPHTADGTPCEREGANILSVMASDVDWTEKVVTGGQTWVLESERNDSSIIINVFGNSHDVALAGGSSLLGTLDPSRVVLNLCPDPATSSTVERLSLGIAGPLSSCRLGYNSFHQVWAGPTTRVIGPEGCGDIYGAVYGQSWEGASTFHSMAFRGPLCQKKAT